MGELIIPERTILKMTSQEKGIKFGFQKGYIPWNKGKNLKDKCNFWKGGKYKNGQGYIMIYSPFHPYRNKRKYVREHRLVMEKRIGRYLTPEEVVHHINDIPNDNRIENLKLFSNNSEHRKFCQHSKKLNIEKILKIRKLLNKKTHKEIATIFNVSIHTIRGIIYNGRWSWVK